MTQNKFMVKMLDSETLEATAELERRYFPLIWCTAANTVCFVCCFEHEPVGLICAMMVGDTAEILSVATQDAHRRQGVARRLICELCTYCEGNKIKYINLDVRESNPAVKLYEKCGFKIVGRRKKYYTAPDEDAVLMTRELKIN